MVTTNLLFSNDAQTAAAASWHNEPDAEPPFCTGSEGGDTLCAKDDNSRQLRAKAGALQSD
jgi:hypothetical protein